MAKHKICIDLGTTNTLIYIDSSASIIFNEPTVIALDQDRKVLEIGYLAAKMIGRTPYNVSVITPLKDGVVADLSATVKFIERAFENLKIKKYMRGSKVFLATPSDVTPVEQKAIVDVALSLEAKSITVDSEARMAALGSGIDLYSPHGSMVVDIGGGTTDVAVVALGEIVKTRAVHIAGNSFNQAIAKHLRTAHHLVVGEKTAEYVKMKIGSVSPSIGDQLLEVNGRDIISGLPHSVIISAMEVAKAITPLAEQICDLVVDILEETPAELSADIVHSGITLCGGGSLLSGMREFFEKRLTIPVTLTPYPLETVINGLIQIAKDPTCGKHTL